MTQHTTKNLPIAVTKMVNEFQCPGCVVGSDTRCGQFKPLDIPNLGISTWTCQSHVPGTMMFPGGSIYLGLPKGFNKVGLNMFSGRNEPHKAIRLWPKVDGKVSAESTEWNKFNVPVWAMERKVGVVGYLFVRTYLPRINQTYIDVIEGGSMSELVPQAIDVGQFYDDID